jgi:Fe-S oxidoreductase
MSASISPDYCINRMDLQYVSTVNNSGEEKYLFGRLNMKTLALIIRLNYTVNPELSIEYYGQPFVSAGRYSEFKKITNANGSNFHNR